MSRIVVLAMVLATVCVCSPAAAAPSAKLPAGVVTIAGGRYGYLDGLAFAQYYAGKTWIGPILDVVRKCKSVRFYGYLSLTRGAGLVGSAPSNLLGCLSVTGGGPGGNTNGCAQAMKTPKPDPFQLSGRQLSSAYILIVATTDLACRDLTTQLSGGIWVRLLRAYNNLPVNSVRVVKCQQYFGNQLWDFVAPFSTSLPASKAAVWIPNSYVYNYASRVAGVPSCN